MLTYIDETLGLVKDKLEEADSSLKSYQKKYGLDGPTSELSTAGDFGKLLELEKQVQELLITLQVTRTVYQKILDKHNPVGESIILASQVQNSPGVASLVQQIQNMLLQRELMQYNFQESSNQIKRLDFHIDVIRGRMAKAVEYQVESLDFKIKEAQQRIKDLESKLFIEKSIDDQIELARLERVYEVNEKYYDELIQQKAEFSLAREGYTPDYRVLSYSRPNDTPVSPNKKLVVGGSFVGWFVIGFLIVVVRYLLFNQILSIADVGKHTSVPFLGIVFQYKIGLPISQLIVDKKPKSTIAEAFRNIRANLDFINSDPGSKLIAVTSTISGEGKTFIALNIAEILALAGKKVVVIDGDMRKPKIHLGFNSPNKRGLSTILIERYTFEDCV